MTFLVRRLDAATVPDFFRVHATAEGPAWCSCVAWWVPDWNGWSERTAAENRAFREELFARGEHDGYLCYDDGAPVGWCQCGPRDRLPKLLRTYGLEPDSSVWAVSCFHVVTTAKLVGTQQLEYYGNVQTQYTVALIARVTDLASGATVVGPENATIQYTAINMQQNLERATNELARTMARRLRALIQAP